MLAYLQLNFIELRYTNDDLVSIGLQIATGEMDANQLARWIIASQHDPPTPNDVI
jgi:prophage maintenance system killer protein